MRTAAKNTQLLALSIALVAVAMMSSGCTRSKASASSDTTTPVTLKVGVGVPLTAGPVAFGQGIQRATELAATQANASDRAKKLGITFEVSPGDDQADPKVGVNVANVFASDPKIVGVVGHVNSGVSIPASKVYADRDIVQITPISTNPALTEQGLSNVFRVCTIDTVQGSAAADFAAKDLGFKTAYVVDDSTPYGEGLGKFFAEQFVADGGKIVGQEKTSDKDSDFTALATKIKATDPDVIYYGGIYNAGALLAKQAREAGLQAAFLGGDGLYDGQFIKLAGGLNPKGDFSTSVGLPIDQLPKGAEFKAAYAAQFPDKELAAYDAYGYDAANVIIEAALASAEKLGADKVATPQGRKAILAAVAAFNGEGITGKLAFDDKGDTLNKAITLYAVKGDAWVPYAK